MLPVAAQRSSYAKEVDEGLANLGVRVLRRLCEQFNKRHLRITVREWAIRYNLGKPHSSLAPGLPEPDRRAFRRLSTDTGCPWASAL